MKGQAYLGAIGRTRTTTVHVSDARGALIAVQVYTSVDAAAQPALAEQLRADELNAVLLDGQTLRLAVPVVYHDPAAGVLALVLGDAHRHREIEERIRVLEALRDDIADVPAYAKDFGVVFGAAGLRTYLEDRARRRDTMSELAAARFELARRGDSPAFDTDQFEAAAGIGGLDSDPEIEVERVIEAEDSMDDADAFDERAFDVAPAMAVADEFPDSFDDEEVPFDENSFDAEISLDDSVPGGDGDGDDDDDDDDDASADGAPADPADAAVTGALHAPESLDPAEALAAALDSGGDLDVDAALEAALEAETGVDGDTDLGDPDDPDAAEVASRLAESADDGTEPVFTDVSELVLPTAATAATIGDAVAAAADLPAPRAAGWHVDAGAVELVIAGDDALAAALAGPIDLRLVLHRTATGPVIALVVGAPAALHVASPAARAVVPIDILGDPDREVLRVLGKGFALTLTVVSGGRAIRRCRLTAPLADNVGYLAQAADEHHHDVETRGALDPAAARARVLGPRFDLLGHDHPERDELRPDRLTQVATAQQLRRALAIARRFTQPALEDYLVCTRGFPLARWHQLRRRTVARAVLWGLWMGPELAQIAVSEGFARSRRDLIVRLDRGFDKLRHDPVAFDIDAEATADNAAAIAEQARALGVALRTQAPNGTGAIASDAGPVAAGSFDTAVPHDATPLPAAMLPMSTDDLLAALDDHSGGRDGRARRLAAALALCDHGDPRVARPVIQAALQMSRGEAVRVLARAVKLGPAAHPALIEGLASSKAYLRHGCALALALARADDATQAVIGLLLSEPTELWHEIALAIGEIGTPALVWLVRDVGSCGPAAEERIAWAMAHVAASGGAPALSAMAAAESIVSPIATKALELLAAVTRDRARDPAEAGAPADRDLSVNHAFSRQFFEALERRMPGDAGGELVVRNAPAAADS